MTKQTYRDLKQKLDDLLTWFDQDDIDVDEAMSKYEEATKIISELEDYLNQAQEKIRKFKA